MIGAFVYFVQNESTGSIKIGHSQDPSARLVALQVGNESLLVLLGTLSGGHVLEGSTQSRFAKSHIRGEWFRADIETCVMNLIRRKGSSVIPTKAKTTSRKRGRPALIEEPERRSIRLSRKDWELIEELTAGPSWSDRVSQLLASLVSRETVLA